MKTFNIWWLALLCTLYGTGSVPTIWVPSLAAVAITSKGPAGSVHPPARGSRRPPRLPLRVVVSHRQPERRAGTRLRHAVDPVQARHRAGDNIRQPWLTPQLWLAQFAITDVSKGSHQQDERTSRQGPGLAGASGGGIG